MRDRDLTATARELVKRTTTQQGLPSTITDADVVKGVAETITLSSTRANRKAG